jgi:hypothetical protein
MKYTGIWREGNSYDIGDCVTHSNRLWFSWSASNTARPGTSNAWQMTQKGG